MRTVVFWVVLAVTLIFIASSMASTARITSLGNGSKYVSDVNDVLNNPALATTYGNVCQIDLGFYAGSGNTPNGQWALFNLGLGDNFAFGGALRRNSGMASEIAGEMDTPTPNPGLDFWAAYNLGSLSCGLGFYGAGYSESMTNDENETSYDYKISTMAFTVSATAPIGDGSAEVGLHFGMNSGKEETTYPDGDTLDPGTITNIYESTGGTEIGGVVRVFYPVGDNLQVVPRVEFGTFSYALQEDDGDTVWEYPDHSMMGFEIGCAANVEVVEDGFVSVGMAMNSFSEKVEDEDGVISEDKTMVFPEITVASEVPATDWLDIRAGVTKQFISVTDINGDVESTNTGSEMSGAFVTVGAGINFGNFTFDINVLEDNLFEGPYFIGGVGNPIAFRAAAVYNW